MRALYAEKMLIPAWVTAALFFVFGSDWLSDARLDNIVWLGGLFFWLFAIILIAAFAVVRHAEKLAEMLGEPFGTLILTLSVVFIEVAMIASVMLTGAENETLARDTMYAVIMIVLNGLVGVTLLFGGLRHREQFYNLQGANSYLAIILPLSVLGLILPNYTQSTAAPTFSTGQSVFLVIATLALYGTFLMAQTMRHRSYFVQPKNVDPVDESMIEPSKRKHKSADVMRHSVLLIAYLLPIIILAEDLAIPIEHSITTLGAPVALGGLLVASLILSPEALGSFRAALDNQLQRAVNIYLGSVAATIGMTIPAVLVIGVLTGKSVVLGLSPENSLLLATTLLVSIVTFITGRTNIVLGAVHLVLFAAYVVLIFD